MIEDYLRNKGVKFEVIRHELAYTAQETAASEHVSGHMFAKTVIVTDGEAFHMLVLPASHQADMKRAGKLVGAKVRLASEEEMAALFTGCETGAEPPFGSVYEIGTYVDPSLSGQQNIVFRAGTHERTLRMRYDDYVALENPTVAEIAAP